MRPYLIPRAMHRTPGQGTRLFAAALREEPSSLYKRQRGYLVVELILAIAIMGTALSVSLYALSAASITARVTGDYATAENIARGQMAYNREQPYQAAPVFYDTVTPPPGFQVSAEAVAVEGSDANTEKIIVTVFRDGQEFLVLEDIRTNN